VIDKAAVEFFTQKPTASREEFAEWLAGGWEGKSSYLKACYQRVAYDAIKELKKVGKMKLARGAQYKVQGGTI
jgi:hypothetical protein